MPFNLKNLFSLEKNIKSCNFLICLTPLLYILGVLFYEIAIFYSSLITSYALITKKLKIKNNYLNIKFFSFLVIIFFSALLSNENVSIFKSLAYLRFYLFYLFVSNFFNFKFFKLFLKIILFSLLFIYFDIFYQYSFGVDIFGYEPGLNFSRYQGPFGDELISGAYIKKYFFISLILFLSINKNIWTNLFLLISIITILITGEKMSSILTIFGVIIFSGFFFKKNKTLPFGIISFFLIIILFFTYPSFEDKKLKRIQDRYTMDFKGSLGLKIPDDPTSESILNSVHFIHWATATELIKLNPLFGHGLKQFRNKCKTIEGETLNKNYGINKNRAEVYRCSSHPHNFYFELLSETGLFSFLIICSIIISYLYKLLTIKKDREIMICLAMALLVHVFPIATTGSFFTNHNSFHFWLLLGLSEFMFLNQSLNKKNEILSFNS